MNIRPAIEADIPSIVDLLKVSLGESLLPKSENYWRWKHLKNPFGESPVLLCHDNDQLIGVRAFMRWQWQHRGKVYQALRAVDTATHPDHQGKGVFKKLTLSLLDYCKERGDDFIFNTPNKFSKPGYLKMGWQEAGRLSVCIGLHRPWHMVTGLVATTSKRQEPEFDSNLLDYFSHPGLAELIDATRDPNHLTSRISIDYLKWRYIDVPVVKYHTIGHGSETELKALMIGRIKRTRFGNEFRITDVFVTDAEAKGALLAELRLFIEKFEIDYCTVSASTSRKFGNLTGGINLTSAVGPTVTVRSIRLSDFDEIKRLDSWGASLGDLELF